MENTKYIKTLEVDLRNWLRPFPTGVIAYDSDDSVIDSEYCETAEEFAAFFYMHRYSVDIDTELVYKLGAFDFNNTELIRLLNDIRDALWKVI